MKLSIWWTVGIGIAALAIGWFGSKKYAAMKAKAAGAAVTK